MKFNFGFDSHKEKDVTPLKISYTDEDIHDILSKHLVSIFRRLPSYQPVIFICVGTDRSTGDSLGPLVGSNLKKYSLSNYPVFGTLDEPVHAMNLTDTLTHIHQLYHDPFIVAVDACLGQLTSVGCIQIAHGPLRPGAGVNKDLPPIGNIHVTGIVNVGGFMEYFVLQNTRLSLVMNMADIISQSFYTSLLQLQRYTASSSVKFE